MSTPQNDLLQQVRKSMKENGIDALIVPGTDPHQSEYPADHWKARHWLSGFSGSAGTAVVTANHAGLWTDSRYYLAAEKCFEESEWQLHKYTSAADLSWQQWLVKNLADEAVVGIHGDYFSLKEVLDLGQNLSGEGIRLRTDFSQWQELWYERPAPPRNSVRELDERFAGESRSDKAARLREFLYRSGADALLVTTLDDIAWLLNVRGSDIEYNPLVLSFLLVLPEKMHWFVQPGAVNAELSARLEKEAVEIHPYSGAREFLENLSADQIRKALYVDPEVCGYSFCAAVNPDIPVITGADPVRSMKALKNGTERTCLRRAMVKDGTALFRFMAEWEHAVEGGDEGLGLIRESDAVSRLRALRSEEEGFQGESFSSIVGYQANGAIIHYDPAQEPDGGALLGREGLLLVDSGGHYNEGTTDVTRTLICGDVTAEQIKDYTLVLKGHIALSRARFPEGTCGYQLDVLARQPLWAHLRHYSHGTGHGVGFYLNVHEGPQKISPHPVQVPLQPGMILSVEPGLYRPGQWGIRIENLVAVCREPEESPFGTFLSFETLTLAPYERRLIDLALLSQEEIAWIDEYHAQVEKALSPRLEANEKALLRRMCRPLAD